MPKFAIQNANKILKKCPNCADKAPKELVSVGMSKTLFAHCSACGTSFNPAGRGCLGWLAIGAIGLIAAALASALLRPNSATENLDSQTPSPQETPRAAEPQPATTLPTKAALSGMPETITTKDGTKYINVTVTRVETNGIVISTDSGIEKIPTANLTRETQTKFGFP